HRRKAMRTTIIGLTALLLASSAHATTYNYLLDQGPQAATCINGVCGSLSVTQNATDWSLTLDLPEAHYIQDLYFNNSPGGTINSPGAGWIVHPQTDHGYITGTASFPMPSFSNAVSCPLGPVDACNSLELDGTGMLDLAETFAFVGKLLNGVEGRFAGSGLA